MSKRKACTSRRGDAFSGRTGNREIDDVIAQDVGQKKGERGERKPLQTTAGWTGVDLGGDSIPHRRENPAINNNKKTRGRKKKVLDSWNGGELQNREQVQVTSSKMPKKTRDNPCKH